MRTICNLPPLLYITDPDAVAGLWSELPDRELFAGNWVIFIGCKEACIVGAIHMYFLKLFFLINFDFFTHKKYEIEIIFYFYKNFMLKFARWNYVSNKILGNSEQHCLHFCSLPFHIPSHKCNACARFICVRAFTIDKLSFVVLSVPCIVRMHAHVYKENQHVHVCRRKCTDRWWQYSWVEERI